MSQGWQARSQSWRVYETNLVFDETIERLRKLPGVKVNHDTETDSRLAGIAYVYRKEVKIAQIGRKGGVELFFFEVEDQEENLTFLRTNVAYPIGGQPRWTGTDKKKLARSYFLSVQNKKLESEKLSLEIDVIKEKLRAGARFVSQIIRKGHLRTPLAMENERTKPLDPRIWEAGLQLVSEHYKGTSAQRPEFLSEALVETILSCGADIPLERLAETMRTKSKE